MVKKTVGQLLRQARKEQGYTLESLAKITRIKVEQLEALENNAYDRLPPAAYSQGFIKNLADVLKLDKQEVLALFRRDYREMDPDYFSKPARFPFRKNFWTMTPQKFSFLIGLGAFVLIGIYLGLNLSSKPVLIVESPLDRETVDTDNITVLGQTTPNVTLLINGQAVELKPDGRFTVKLTLKQGLNTISIVASPPFGRENQVKRVIFYQVDGAASPDYPEEED